MLCLLAVGVFYAHCSLRSFELFSALSGGKMQFPTNYIQLSRDKSSVMTNLASSEMKAEIWNKYHSRIRQQLIQIQIKTG